MCYYTWIFNFMQTRNRQISRFLASVEILSKFDHVSVTQNTAVDYIYVRFSAK